MKKSFRIGLAAWIIQDGNYPDFSAGQEYGFALRFYAQPFALLRQGLSKCKYLQDCLYEITAPVVFRKGNLSVIDFGILAYTEQNLGAEVGDWIIGNIDIDVDPFMYFENWERQPDVPKLRNKWRIDRIFLETTPLIEEKPKYFVRDAARFSEIEVTKTDAWNDDNGNGSYRLECIQLEKPQI